MDLHFDLRLKNNSNAKITERMHSLRHNAGIVASEFLWMIIIILALILMSWFKLGLIKTNEL